MTFVADTAESILYGQAGTRLRATGVQSLPGLDCFSTALASGYFEDKHGWSGCGRWLVKLEHIPTEMLPTGVNQWKLKSEETEQIIQLIVDINRRNEFSNTRSSLPKSFWQNLDQCVINMSYDRNKSKASIAPAADPDKPRLFTQQAYIRAIEHLIGGGGTWKLRDRSLYYLLGEEAGELVHGCIPRLSITK